MRVPVVLVQYVYVVLKVKGVVVYVVDVRLRLVVSYLVYPVPDVLVRQLAYYEVYVVLRKLEVRVEPLVERLVEVVVEIVYEVLLLGSGRDLLLACYLVAEDYCLDSIDEVVDDRA